MISIAKGIMFISVFIMFFIFVSIGYDLIFNIVNIKQYIFPKLLTIMIGSCVCIFDILVISLIED